MNLNKVFINQKTKKTFSDKFLKKVLFDCASFQILSIKAAMSLLD